MCVRASCRGGEQLAQFWRGMHPVSLCPSSCRRTQAGPQRSQSHQTRAQFWMATSLSPPRKRNGNGMKRSGAKRAERASAFSPVMLVGVWLRARPLRFQV